MLTAFVGEAVPLSLMLGDYATGLFPRARVYSGTSLVVTVALSDVGLGFYFSTWTPSTGGRYSIVFDVYTDVRFTSLSDTHDAASDEVQVLSTPLAEESSAIRQAYTLDTTSNAIIVNAWVELDGSQVSSGLSNATLVLYEHDGTVIASPSAQASPILQGVFRFIITPIPGFALGENAAFSVCTVDYVGPPSRTFRGVTGVTFSRSS